KGSVYYTCIPNLWRLQDTKGTGTAGVKTILRSGFGVRIAYLGHDLHGLALGPDGKLYFSVGDRGYNVNVGGKQIDGHDRGAVFRCNPDGSEFEIFATGLRNPQKLAFDKYGNLFTADNNADLGDSARWVYVVEGGDSGWRCGYQFIQKPNPLGMWTSEKMWYEFHEGQPAFIVPPIKQLGTGPSGIAYFPGTGCLPARYADHFFYCDYIGNGGVFSFSVKAKGAGFEYVEDKDREFFWKTQATDICFGIDGAAYSCVWVGGINHSGKGRIYRILDPTMKDDAAVLGTKKLLSEGFDKRAPEECAKLLAHSDQRVRQGAQFALVEKGVAAIPVFIEALKTQNQLARIHAIWGLGQIAHDAAYSKLSADERDKNLSKPWDEKALETLPALFEDKDAEVVAQAARICGDGRFAKAHDGLIKLLAHESLRVRFFAAYGLGKLQSSAAIEPLCAALRENADKDAFVRHACVMALYWIAEKYPELVIAKGEDASSPVRMAVLLVLRRMEDARIARFLKDKSPLLVLEAARAINDVPIPAAFPELAALAVPPDEGKKDASSFSFKAEFWENVTGNSVGDLTKNKSFPDKPDSTLDLDAFETPSDRADNYGARVSGVITAPQTGDYFFWIAVDDCGQLWLSSDETPEHKKMIAETKVPQWEKPREWEKYPNQKSAAVKLEAGKKYYIEALMKEVAANDNLAVGWQLPDGTTQRPIGNPERDEPSGLIRRALNAAFRLGGADQAKALAAYCARKDAPAAVRVEALTMLSEWAAPPARDKIMNLVRPLPARDAAPAAAALAPNLETLIMKTTGNDVPVAAESCAAKLQIKEAVPVLLAAYDDAKKSSEIHVAALNALFELSADGVLDRVRKAIAGKDANLKKAGSALLAKLSPQDALAAMKRALENEQTPYTEKQFALSILSGMKASEADEIVGKSMDQVLAGKIQAEIELDVTEAARKLGGAALKEKLEKYDASIPRTEHKSVQMADYKSALLGGDADAGRKIFYENASGQCIRCHKLNGFGGTVGPELKGIGAREKREYLLESIVDPSAKIAKGYETVLVKTTEGKIYTGVLKTDDETKIVLIQGDGKSVEIPKAEVKTRKNQEESTMPQMGSVLSKMDIRNLVEFLVSLK
ncbi:MAG TPA: HEAT repeat domain-containing protein, partial [Planctomycetota bacterium]|nr:HEAT repeat domain-containing protein [Planctomycetota bacterium]